MKLRIRAAAATAAAIALAAPAAAPAAKVPVDLRIEGATGTIFEGRLDVDVRRFQFTDESTKHTCDGTAAIGGTSTTPQPTRGAAISAAAKRFGFSMTGTWNDAFGPTFERIGGQNVGFNTTTQEFLAEYENWQFAQVGACGDPVQSGDDVLFAYAKGTETLLALSGPEVVAPGAPVTVRVSDGATGAPVAGASVGGATTGADGTATLTFTDPGYQRLKAEKEGAIRSNLLRICAGECAPIGRITDIEDGDHLDRGPRKLRGVIEAAPLELDRIRLRLVRRRGGRWFVYSKAREAFVRRPEGTRKAFGIAAEQDWAYKLPHRLGRGRYVLDVIARDEARNKDAVERGRSRVVFHVG
jgi:hypothetical protein